MNRKLVLGFAIALVATQLWAQDKAAKKVELKTTDDKAAYALGTIAASDLRGYLDTLGIDIDSETIQRGFRDALSGGKLALSEEDLNAALQTQRNEVSKRNAEEGEKFLEANGKKKDVVTTKSGLQYKILKKGTGKAPSMHDVVSVNFRGRFLTGKEFANTYESKEQFVIPVANVIEGWKEALTQMPAGSKWELYIPPDLAYGEQGGNNIGPNKTLVYEIELVGVTKPPAAGAMVPRGKGQAPEEVK
jgi:FKBP-type peptidyl-prolyl cis-trans isomerase FklB